MKNKWNEMTKEEKIHYIVSLIFGLVAAVFAVIDFSTDWQYARFGWNISFALYLGIEAKGNWNKNRKIAILDLAFGILLFVIAIVSLFL